MARPKGKLLKIGRNCRWVTLNRADGRTQEGKILNQTRRFLVNYLGGSPTIPQQLLIERTAWLALRVAQMEAKMASGELTVFDNNHYLSWVNALGKTLARLGITGIMTDDPAQHSLAEYIAARAAEGAEQAAPGMPGPAPAPNRARGAPPDPAAAAAPRMAPAARGAA